MWGLGLYGISHLKEHTHTHTHTHEPHEHLLESPRGWLMDTPYTTKEL